MSWPLPAARPRATFDAWHQATGIRIIDGIGATEMLHIFISNRLDDLAPGSTGKPVRGYEAKVVDEDMKELPRGTVGRLAVRGPTGCRYLDDPRQTNYVKQGWNLTGDTFTRDADGYYWYQARSDDMIVSSGYNISDSDAIGIGGLIVLNDVRSDVKTYIQDATVTADTLSLTADETAVIRATADSSVTASAQGRPRSCSRFHASKSISFRKFSIAASSGNSLR